MDTNIEDELSDLEDATDDGTDDTPREAEYKEYADGLGENYTPIITHHFDERIQLQYWEKRLRQNTTPKTPETEFVPLKTREEAEGLYGKWDNDEVRKKAALVGGEAFVRTQYKSAGAELYDGSYITHEMTDDQIKRTLGVLITSTVSQGRLIDGGGLAIREHLPLDFAPYATENLHPEIRFFIEDGDVKYHYLRTEKQDFKRATGGTKMYRQMCDMVEWKLDELYQHAESVAEEFTEGAWSVDFVITTEEEIYCIDMAIDALYYNPHKEEWINLSGHYPDGTKFSLEDRFADGLPEPDELEDRPSTYTYEELREIATTSQK